MAPQYDYTAARGQAFAAQQVAALQSEVAPIDAAFAADLSADARQAALAAALPDLSSASRTTLLGLDASGWTALRGQMITTLEEAQSVEVRDTLLPTARAALGQRLPTSLAADQRALATEILTPAPGGRLELRPGRHDRRPGRRRGGRAARRRPRRQGRAGRPQGGAPRRPADVEKLNALGFDGQPADTYRIAGWFVLAVLVIGTLLAWLWRFRPELWHRTNTLVLLGLLLIAATAGLELTATRSILPFFLPLAAIGILTAILLDAGTATILTALVAAMAAVVVGSAASPSSSAFTLLGGLAGIIAVRRGERVQHFLQAASSWPSSTSWSWPCSGCSASTTSPARCSCGAPPSPGPAGRPWPRRGPSRPSAMSSASPPPSSCSSWATPRSRSCAACCWTPPGPTTTR